MRTPQHPLRVLYALSALSVLVLVSLVHSSIRLLATSTSSIPSDYQDDVMHAASLEESASTATTDNDFSSSSAVHVKRKPSKPKLIIHVGPGKTGTSTLQFDLTKHRDSLLSDGYVYLGKDPIAHGLVEALKGCPVEMKQTRKDGGSIMETMCWQIAKEQLSEHWKRKENLIFSAEEYSFGYLNQRFDSPEFRETFLPALEKWDVLIVATYR
jgi:hypothetical protein